MKSSEIELLNALLPLEQHWKEMPVHDEVSLVRWFPLARVSHIGGTYLGLDAEGRWALGEPWQTEQSQPGHFCDPASKDGFLYLTPMLDWLPRTVMGDVRLRAGWAGRPFAEVWDIVPWRYVIYSGIASHRMQYLKPAVDWAIYLGVLDQYSDALQAASRACRVDALWIDTVLRAAQLPWPRVDEE